MEEKIFGSFQIVEGVVKEAVSVTCAGTPHIKRAS